MKTPPAKRIGLLVILGIIAGILWGANWYLVDKFYHDPAQRGQFGDMFGAVNSLFTALAFAGLIYTALLQRDQLAVQQKEIIESGETQKELVQSQIEAHKKLAEWQIEQQNLFQEAQRKKQIEHELKLEDMRQSFATQAELDAERREVEANKRFMKNVLRAIRCELEVITDIYDKGIGAYLANLPEGQTFHVRLGLTQNWFTVFDANAVHLGKLAGELARQIVGIYLMSKSLIEEYRINNDYLDRLDKLSAESANIPTGLTDPKIVILGHMKVQANRIKERDADLKARKAALFILFDERGIR